MLYILGGLPGTGKTELSKFLATKLGAVYLRIDTIEQRLRDQGITNLYDEGYQVAFALALDNLNNGVSVVADSTNPVQESRQAWIHAAEQAQSRFVEIQVICSDEQEHRKRVETRKTDVPNLTLPSWQSVITRDYQSWESAQITIDTAGKTPEQSKDELMQLLNAITLE